MAYSLIRKGLVLFAPLLMTGSLHSQGLPSLGARIVGDTSALAFLSPSQFSSDGSLSPNLLPAPKTAALSHPWKTKIVATVFWVGEQPGPKNPVSNSASSWDHAWIFNFGGYDDPSPERRTEDFRPASFIPRQNPFYVALPYNDCIDNRTTKTEASKVIPWFKKTFQKHGKSVCQNRWIAIRYGGRTCYAQWSDCGPFLTTDAKYVFGEARPATGGNHGAGIDLAPAVRDYLGFASGQTCDWRFVELDEVPDGPWKLYGSNNHFASDAMKHLAPMVPVLFVPAPGGDRNTVSPAGKSAAAASPALQLTGAARIDELRRQRDAWFKAGSR